MAVDIQKLFDEELPASLAKYPDQAKQIGGTFQFIITREGGGEWWIDASETGPRSQSGNRQADVTITMAAEDFQTFYANPQTNAISLFFAGRIQIAGNEMLAKNFVTLFSLGS